MEKALERMFAYLYRGRLKVRCWIRPQVTLVDINIDVAVAVHFLKKITKTELFNFHFVFNRETIEEKLLSLVQSRTHSSTVSQQGVLCSSIMAVDATTINTVYS